MTNLISVRVTISVILVSLLFINDVHRSYSQDFGYDGKEGPKHWADVFKGCKGKFQSPINVQPEDAIPTKYKDLHLEEFLAMPMKLIVQNNGHTVKLTVPSNETVPLISGGPLYGKYQFDEIHMHWGKNDSSGSETVFDGKSFSMELHAVFHKVAYGSRENSLAQPDGICVLAFFYEVGDSSTTDTADWDAIITNVVNPGQRIEVTKKTKLEKYIKTDFNHYYTYQGSLTTPPCSESVIWIQFFNPSSITSHQLDLFRRIKDAHGKFMTHNYRPLQSVGERNIYYNNPEKYTKSSKRSNEDKDDDRTVVTTASNDGIDDDKNIVTTLAPDAQKSGASVVNNLINRGIKILSRIYNFI